MTETGARRSMLRTRIVSALVMIPPALAAVWFGPPWIILLVAAAGIAMGWEWGRMSGAGQFGIRDLVILAAIVIAAAVAAFGRYEAAVAVAAMGAAVSLAWPGERSWTALGTLWIAIGCVAFIWLATPPQGGRTTLFWLLAVVWATDIGAYFSGKSIGGPRLAPRLSPNKTWAGLAGGLVAAALVGFATAHLTDEPAGPLIVASLILSLFAQAGDLAESGAKRHFAVKDSSSLIPGHGGALDRLDGLLAAAIAGALLTYILAGGPLELR